MAWHTPQLIRIFMSRVQRRDSQAIVNYGTLPQVYVMRSRGSVRLSFRSQSDGAISRPMPVLVTVCDPHTLDAIELYECDGITVEDWLYELRDDL